EWEILGRLKLARPLASGRTHAVWLQNFSSIDIWSHKFIRQKLNYIHLNLSVRDCTIIQRSGVGPAIMHICLTSRERSLLRSIGAGDGMQPNSQQRRTSQTTRRTKVLFKGRTCAPTAAKADKSAV